MKFRQALIAVTCMVSFSAVQFAYAQNTDQSAQSGADFGSSSRANDSPEVDLDEKGKPEDTEQASPAAIKTPPPTNVKQDSAKAKETPDKSESSEKSDAVASPQSTTENADKKSEATDQNAKTAANPETSPAGLTVASWGGAYAESQKRAYFSPFENETGIKITTVSHKGKFDQLQDTTKASSPAWDIVDLDIETLEMACKNGSLEKVETSSLKAAKDGKPASEDFLPGTLHECGIPSVAWSTAIVFDKQAYKKAQPKTARDFFDVKRFPGKRALPKDPKYIVELALMADGVKPENVYKELSSEDGIAKAFKQLDQLREHIMWWEKAHLPLKLLAERDVTLALAFNGRIFSSIVAENRPYGIVWDGQVFDLDFWAIPKSSSRKEDSLKFIAFATKPESMAKQASWFPYGPARKSAISLVGAHPEVNVSMTEFLPTTPANFKRALRLDTSWWKENGENIRKKYGMWSDGIQDPSSFEDEQQQ